MSADLQHIIFAVCDQAYCGWDFDAAENNITFINGIDADYFDYIVGTHQPQLQGDDNQRAAIALQSNYYLCLETLFGLIGAALQAPGCVPGWVLKATTTQVRTLTDALSRGVMAFPISWKPAPSHLDFKFAANLIFSSAPWNDDGATIDRFALLWRRLAGDFLDPLAIAEYNSVKHGFRAKAGGFFLSYRLESSGNQAVPLSEKKNLGGSLFGSTFYEASRIANAPKIKSDPHFILRTHSRNWSPPSTIEKILLASMSIKNVKSFLSIANGLRPDNAPFLRPSAETDFEKPWQSTVGITSFSAARILSEEHITRFRREDLTKLLRELRESNADSQATP